MRGYNAVQITLQSDGLSDEVVAKEAIPNLQSPSFGYVENSSRQKIAYYWACLNATRDRIQLPNKNGNSPNYDGFVYKMKGFTIGDRQRLRSKFLRKPQLYPWYTGEIYIIDDNIVPNAARNDFEN
ncbi:MAG: hypothetical protein IPO81_08755 [Kouleothrix sp.]|nr:hypothetical protein [Kouleothrix sp.]